MIKMIAPQPIAAKPVCWALDDDHKPYPVWSYDGYDPDQPAKLARSNVAAERSVATVLVERHWSVQMKNTISRTVREEELQIEVERLKAWLNKIKNEA